jgi:hypothetical protein
MVKYARIAQMEERHPVGFCNHENRKPVQLDKC